MLDGVLRQATATTVVLGPLFSNIDALDPLTTASSPDSSWVTIYLDGVDQGGIDGNTFDVPEEGHLSVLLSAVDLATNGLLKVIVNDDSDARVDSFNFLIVPANIYDAFIPGTDYLQTDATQVEGTDATTQIAALLTAQLGSTRINQRAGRAFRLALSDRNDGTYRATKPARVTNGTLTSIAVEIDVAPAFRDLRLASVGTPVVPAASSITCTALGHRDDGERQLVMVSLGGTAADDEDRTIEVPFVMATGEAESLEFRVKARAAGAA